MRWGRWLDAADGQARAATSGGPRRASGRRDAERGPLVDAELEVVPAVPAGQGRSRTAVRTSSSGARSRTGPSTKSASGSSGRSAARPRGPWRRRRGRAWRDRCADRRTRGCRRPCRPSGRARWPRGRDAGHQRPARPHGRRPLEPPVRDGGADLQPSSPADEPVEIGDALEVEHVGRAQDRPSSAAGARCRPRRGRRRAGRQAARPPRRSTPAGAARRRQARLSLRWRRAGARRTRRPALRRVAG